MDYYLAKSRQTGQVRLVNAVSAIRLRVGNRVPIGVLVVSDIPGDLSQAWHVTTVFKEGSNAPYTLLEGARANGMLQHVRDLVATSSSITLNRAGARKSKTRKVVAKRAVRRAKQGQSRLKR